VGEDDERIFVSANCNVTGLQPQFVHATLARLRDSAAPIFGADSHRFLVHPPASEAEISAFEKRFGVQLPIEYRDFLTQVGNGGAGPGYGIFRLGEVDDGFRTRRFDLKDDLVGDPSEPFPFTEEWSDLTGSPTDELLTQNENLYWEKVEVFERRYFSPSLVNGAIPICHLGCAIRIQLVVTGPQRGFLWRDGRSEETGLQPLQFDGRAATFASWYGEWLIAALRTVAG
jgi:hypothetical protein